MIDAPAPVPHSLAEGLRQLESRWPYFIGFGVLLAGLGILALGVVAIATLASVFSIGFLMILAGVVEISIGLSARGWGRLFLWAMAGILYALAGLIAISRPMMAAEVFTLMLGAGLIASGLVRTFVSFHLPLGSPRWGALLSAAVTIVFGLVVVLGWPGDSQIVLGTILGVDLIFAGAGWLGLGMALRSRAQSLRG